MSATPPSETTQQPPNPSSRRTTVLVVLAAISLVAVPLILSEGNREIALWHQADATEKQLDGDLEGAVKSLDRALESSDDSEIYLQRADTRLDQGDVSGCLEDCEVVIRRTLSGPYHLLLMAYDLQSRAHLKSGQYVKAVENQKKIGELLTKQPRLMRRSSYLNSLAYYCAVGGIELDQALSDANKSVELTGDADGMQDALLRCYLETDWSGATRVFNEVTMSMRKRFSRELRTSAEQIYDEICERFPPSKSSRLLAERMARKHLRAAERLPLLELRRVRSPTGGANGGSDQTPQPSPALQRAIDTLPELPESIQTLSEFSQCLDTRGFILLNLAVRNATEAAEQRSRLAAARADLDRAVVAMEAVFHASRTALLRLEHKLPDTRAERVRLKMLAHNVAVIRYHRALLMQEMGELERAALDNARVRQLGYEPDERLY